MPKWPTNGAQWDARPPINDPVRPEEAKAACTQPGPGRYGDPAGFVAKPAHAKAKAKAAKPAKALAAAKAKATAKEAAKAKAGQGQGQPQKQLRGRGC